MPRKKKNKEETKQSSTNLFHTSAKKTEEPTRKYYVLCPLHKRNIERKILDHRQIAICTCDVPDNKYKGRTVWERDDTRRIL